MATFLSTTPLSNPLPLYRKIFQSSPHFCSSLSPIQSLNLHIDLKWRKKLVTFSPGSHPPTVTSSVSGSAGCEQVLNLPLVGEDTTNLLEMVKVFDLKGNEVSISDLWKDRKAVVAFSRHFGCVLCRKRADHLASKKANVLAEQTKFQGGLKIIQLYMEGYRQDWKLTFKKDTLQKGLQGGIIVAGPGKSNIVYMYKDKETEDYPNIEDILKACCS